jgi:hypothetical protein
MFGAPFLLIVVFSAVAVIGVPPWLGLPVAIAVMFVCTLRLGVIVSITGRGKHKHQ